MSLYTIYNNDRRIKVKPDQLNRQSLGQAFGLFPKSVYLISEDGELETADECGVFVDLRSFIKYEVRGNTMPSDQSLSAAENIGMSRSPSIHATVASGSKTRPKGISIKAKWPAKPPGVTANSKDEWTKNIEVHHHNNGNLVKFSNFPINLKESTANTRQISQLLSIEAFSGEKVILLDNDNLQIPDTTASRGQLHGTCNYIFVVCVIDFLLSAIMTFDFCSMYLCMPIA